jgi:tRNA-binding protein
MIDRLDIRFGKVIDIRPFSDKPDSPRRKFCVIRVEFPGVGVRQSVGQFARHKDDLLGRTVLCLINLGSKNMFGQASEVLVMGVPHPDGGVIPGDAHEAQATYLEPLEGFAPAVGSGSEAKPQQNFEDWLTADIRLGEVVDQSESALTLRVAAEQETWTVPLPAPMAASVVGRRLITARVPQRPGHGQLPLAADGTPLLARPNDPRPVPGAKVY